MPIVQKPFKHLLSGYDTIECAYYLKDSSGTSGNFYSNMAAAKESLRAGKHKQKTIRIGSDFFSLSASGTSSGYTYKIENKEYAIQFGEFNKPNFYVTYSSFGLWHLGAEALHKKFLEWAASIGFVAYEDEKLSRVDFAFDYEIPILDFDQDCFVSIAAKDSRYRNRGSVQTMQFGSSPIILRVYNKSEEISDQSGKTWFYAIWDAKNNVWRFEWEIRKDELRSKGIKTFADLWNYQAELLKRLVTEHTTLRIQSDFNDPKDCPVHPLWLDMAQRINELRAFTPHVCDEELLLEQRLMHIAISVYGYLKRVSAINILQQNAWEDDLHGAFELLRDRVEQIHDPLTWPSEVKRKASDMKVGK